jgi:hypothetical protein
MMMKQFRGRQGCTHRVVPEHRGGQDGLYGDSEKEEKEEKVGRVTT